MRFIKHLLLILLFIPFLSAGQEDVGFRSVLKLEFLKGGIHYELKTSEKWSVNVAIRYAYKSFFNSNKYDFQLISDYRFYPKSKMGFPVGIHLGPYIFYKDYIVTGEQDSMSVIIKSKDGIKEAGVGFLLGRQMVFSSNITFDVQFGLGYNIYLYIINYEGLSEINRNNHSLHATADLTLGYTF